MVNRFLITLIAFVFISCSGGTNDQLQGDGWGELSELGEGEVTLAYVPSEGFSYLDENGNLTGVTIELVRDFVDYINNVYGVDVQMRYQAIENFSEFYQRVKDARGGVFGVANVTITENRKEEISFSPPYLQNIATLITNQETEELESFENIEDHFNSLKALAFEGTLHEERLVRLTENYFSQDVSMEYAFSNDEIIEKVSDRNEYFAYVDVYNYWRAINAGAEITRHEIGDDASEQFGVIMPKGSDWEGIWTEFFEGGEGYVQSEKYEMLLKKHLGEDLAELLYAQMQL